jgi:small subunit ribosomal protein S5
VTKVTKGGKTFRFKSYVVSGDGNGKIGVGKGAGKDISIAIAKATTRARKYLFPVFKKDTTIPYAVYGKHGASQVMLSPAYKGSGLIAGGSMRLVLKAVGIEDIVAKSIGTSRSGVNLVKATLNALAKCRQIDHIMHLRNKTKKQIILGSHYEA